MSESESINGPGQGSLETSVQTLASKLTAAANKSAAEQNIKPGVVLYQVLSRAGLDAGLEISPENLNPFWVVDAGLQDLGVEFYKSAQKLAADTGQHVNRVVANALVVNGAKVRCGEEKPQPPRGNPAASARVFHTF